MNPDQNAESAVHGLSIVDTSKIIDGLNPNTPEVFRQQAQQTAVFVARLDAGQGIDDDPAVQKFIKQLNRTYYIDEVRASMRSRGLNSKTVLPPWLQIDFLVEHSLDRPRWWLLDAEGRKIAQEKYDMWVEKRMITSEHILHPGGAGGRYDRLREVREGTPVTRVFKLYVEHRDIIDSLDSGAIDRVVGQLSEKGLDPYEMKLFDGDSLVSYFDQDINRAPDIGDIFQKNGVNYRGPVQDQIFVKVLEDGSLRLLNGDSNDNVLWKGNYDASGYNPEQFLADYLSLCFKAGKNPTIPYLTSFVRLIDYNGEHMDQKDEIVANAEALARYPILYTTPAPPQRVGPLPRRVAG